MARYVDADALIVYFDVLAKKSEMLELFERANFFNSFLNIIEDNIEVDVAPRADVTMEILDEIEIMSKNCLEIDIKVLSLYDKHQELYRKAFSSAAAFLMLGTIVKELRKKYESEGTE